jgi:hypothetical protein
VRALPAVRVRAGCTTADHHEDRHDEHDHHEREDAPMTTNTPRPPAGLGRAGSTLWRSIVAAYFLSAGERAMLHLAAKQADSLAGLEAQLATEGMTVAGSKGQPRMHPAVAELRQGRLALSRLLASLALPGDDETAGRTPTSRHAQRAASIRWSRVARIAEARRGDTA